MLVEAVILGMITGLIIRRGQLGWLAQINLKYLYLPVVAMMLEYMGTILLRLGYGQSATWVIEFLVYGILFTFIWLNASKSAMLLIMVGIALNALVIFTNGGMMPVDVDKPLDYGYEQKVNALYEGHIFGHQVMTEKTTFKGLADIFYILPPYPMPKSFSVGDICISAGVLILLISGALIERSDTCT